MEAGEEVGRSKGEGGRREVDHSAAASALCAHSVLPRRKKFAHLIYVNVIAFTPPPPTLLAPISRVQVFFVFFILVLCANVKINGFFLSVRSRLQLPPSQRQWSLCVCARAPACVRVIHLALFECSLPSVSPSR